MKSIFTDPVSKKPLTRAEQTLIGDSGTYDILPQGIPDLIYPRVLPEMEGHSQKFYDGRAKQYDDTLHLTFYTHGLNEDEVRNGFIDKLNLKPDSKVLEIACGTGRDSVLIANRLGAGAEFHMQDISADMISLCVPKLEGCGFETSFCLSNAAYLPYPDNYFDCTYSFGAMGEFGNKKTVIAEMVRVTKPGGKIVFGDECVPVWLRKTEYYKILLKTNPMFAEEVPFEDFPVEARELNIKWVIGSTFYLVDFEVGQGEPTANFDYIIPGTRGGSYRTRYEGELEGVKPDTKRKAWEYVVANKLNMHDWLDGIVNNELSKK